MHRKPWDELTDLQRREEIGLRLGWYLHSEGHTEPIQIWKNRNVPDLRRQGHLPDWTTDDGLAFTEVWPKLLAKNRRLILFKPLGTGPTKRAVGELKIDREHLMQDIAIGENWASAICEAAYEILPTQKSAQQIGATK